MPQHLAEYYRYAVIVSVGLKESPKSVLVGPSNTFGFRYRHTHVGKPNLTFGATQLHN